MSDKNNKEKDCHVNDDDKLGEEIFDMPEPNFEAHGRNKKPNITGREVTLCPECSLPLSLCGYGGDHYNNDTF